MRLLIILLQFRAYFTTPRTFPCKLHFGQLQTKLCSIAFVDLQCRTRILNI